MQHLYADIKATEDCYIYSQSSRNELSKVIELLLDAILHSLIFQIAEAQSLTNGKIDRFKDISR